MDFTPSTWLVAGAGATLGVFAGMWDKVKAFAWRGMNLFVQRIEVPSHPAHEAITAYLIANYQRSRNYDRMYGASWEFQRDGRYGLIPFEQFGNRTLILWNGWFPFLFANQQEQKAAAGKGNNDSHGSSATKIYSTLTFLRGTLDVEKILSAACAVRNAISWAAEEAEQETKTRFVIHHVPKRGDKDDDSDYGSNGLAWYQQGTFRLLAHSPDQLGKRPTANGKALDNLIFPQRIKDLIREIELWRKSREWYREKGIPWKRGWMLYGPPGTGKTALARAFAEDMNMPIYVYNLAEMGNHELMRTWGEMQMNVPCIALIEDIDNVFHGRENVARKNNMFSMMLPPPKKDDNDNDGDRGRGAFGPPLTFDCLLNCLDGVERSDGIFTIVTTNDISKIDPALGQPRKLPDGAVEFISTRPGRVDKAVELGFMEAADKKKMARRILGAYEKQYLETLEFIDRFPDLQETPAQFQERCAQIALKCFWNEQHAAKAAKPSVARVAEELLNSTSNGLPVGASNGTH
ncbi:AAA family ATPase [Fimbriiglobus ruber]|uniref:Cell division protein FtsH n=1 Tax=Fimbriiglobus ruber TaxID=1908690 RepID=A0A225DE74_9BACT|nr:AAA family ATPase [Fimbriiglobus ruber]OWK37944.1 Cell division protein FtsH [Fimbriiglobus ruber]